MCIAPQVLNHAADFPRALSDLADWLATGKLQSVDTVFDGFCPGNKGRCSVNW